jgi:hypothetical protein
MEMTVETTVTLHLKNDNFLKQKAGLTLDLPESVLVTDGEKAFNIIAKRVHNGETIALSPEQIKACYKKIGEIVDEVIWDAIDIELETLDGK